MKNVSTSLKSHYQQGVTTLARCIEIIRKDGQSFHFTDHDYPLLIDNNTYTPANSFAGTSITQPIDLEIDGAVINGILNSSAVSRDEIAAGMFDFAETQFFIVNYEDLSSGKVMLRKGWLGECVLNEDKTFRAELRGLGQAYATRIGELYTPTCRADLGDRRCKFPLRPKFWQPLTDYALGDSVLVHANVATDAVEITFSNASWEDDGQVANLRDPIGWTTYGAANGTWATLVNMDVVGGPEVVPGDGTLFLAHTETVLGTTELGAYQDADLVALGITAENLDTGLCRLHSTILLGSMENSSRSRFRVFTLDEAGTNQTLLYDSGPQRVPTKSFRQKGISDVLIPAGTRYLRFDIFATKKSSSLYGACFDGLKAVVNLPAGTYNNEYQAGAFALVCVNPGKSGTTEPEMPLFGTIDDGAASWEPKGRNFVISEVVSVSSNQTFVGSAINRPSGYYDGGLLYWETGKSAGRAMEIKAQTGSQITTFMRTYHTPEVGDRFIVYPSCDGRLVTCRDKFQNVINFRGEPHVPGQDQYTMAPNADGGFGYSVSDFPQEAEEE